MTRDDRRAPPPDKPVLSARGRRAEAERQARAAAALRENLARRKRQQRARAGGPDADLGADLGAELDEGTPKPDVE